MKLHDAIVEILKQAGNPMSTQQIADRLNETGLYMKRDGSAISAFQIHGRTRNYSHLFDRNGSVVSLKGKIGVIARSDEKQTKINESKPAIRKVPKDDIEEIEMRLLDSANFKDADAIDRLVPFTPGLYCIRIKEPDALPVFFSNQLRERKHNILYIGIATRSLNRRMLNQELRANGNGTFFRSTGAVLGFCPPLNSLAGKKNKRNYKFSEPDEQEIISWINDNLQVSWVETNNPKAYEKQLIVKYLPLLNLDHNPVALPELSALRKKCVEVANGSE